jgi:hypothetical protein
VAKRPRRDPPSLTRAQDDVIDFARMPLEVDPKGSTGADLTASLFQTRHLDEIPAPEEDESVERREPAKEELLLAAHAMAISLSFRRLATELKHGLVDAAAVPEVASLVQAGSQLFDFWGDSPSRCRSMILALVDYQTDGLSDAASLRGAALGVVNGICERMPNLSAAAKTEESLRALVAVVRAWAQQREGGPGIDTALDTLFTALGVPLKDAKSVRQARMDWKRAKREGGRRPRKGIGG